MRDEEIRDIIYNLYRDYTNMEKYAARTNTKLINPPPVTITEVKLIRQILKNFIKEVDNNDN